jgi:hypothetical protein
MAGQLAAAGKEVLFPGFKEMLMSYLDITPLMPPERLHYSKLLHRPLMEDADAGEDSIAPAYLEELPPECEAEVRYRHIDAIYCARGRLAELPLHYRNASTFWVCIRSTGDREFATEWKAKCGQPWPHVDGAPHPALANLRRVYMKFWGAWHDRGDAIMNTYRRGRGMCVTVVEVTNREGDEGEDSEGQEGSEGEDMDADRPFESLARR